ncbi:hypothetical protein IWZ03DRAFT_363999 [Phyllosticta citriasiana]|uniref:Uncharacterized protein n=1 Tax=Phyllosticta citriasiana TaxID=595635 RepID=A0ABR1KAI6_9PEZI
MPSIFDNRAIAAQETDGDGLWCPCSLSVVFKPQVTQGTIHVRLRAEFAQSPGKQESVYLRLSPEKLAAMYALNDAEVPLAIQRHLNDRMPAHLHGQYFVLSLSLNAPGTVLIPEKMNPPLIATGSSIIPVRAFRQLCRATNMRLYIRKHGVRQDRHDMLRQFMALVSSGKLNPIDLDSGRRGMQETDANVFDFDDSPPPYRAPARSTEQSNESPKGSNQHADDASNAEIPVGPSNPLKRKFLANLTGTAIVLNVGSDATSSTQSALSSPSACAREKEPLQNPGRELETCSETDSSTSLNTSRSAQARWEEAFLSARQGLRQTLDQKDNPPDEKLSDKVERLISERLPNAVAQAMEQRLPSVGRAMFDNDAHKLLEALQPLLPALMQRYAAPTIDPLHKAVDVAEREFRSRVDAAMEDLELKRAEYLQELQEAEVYAIERVKDEHFNFYETCKGERQPSTTQPWGLKPVQIDDNIFECHGVRTRRSRILRERDERLEKLRIPEEDMNRPLPRTESSQAEDSTLPDSPRAQAQSPQRTRPSTLVDLPSTRAQSLQREAASTLRDHQSQSRQVAGGSTLLDDPPLQAESSQRARLSTLFDHPGPRLPPPRMMHSSFYAGSTTEADTPMSINPSSEDMEEARERLETGPMARPGGFMLQGHVSRVQQALQARRECSV